MIISKILKFWGAHLIEVEVKASVKDFSDVRERLIQIGAVKIKKEHQKDVYFNAPHKDFGSDRRSLKNKGNS